jgi:23S rRNA (guanosine2251-2'-O)-methyltransferase
VLAALEAGTRELERIVVQRGRRDRRVGQILTIARERRVPVRLEEREVLDRLADGAVHQGVVAVAGELRHFTEEEVLDRAGEAAFLLVLDRIEDPRNLGAVVRTAAAAGVDGIFLPERGSSGATPAVHRAAAGAMERVPLVRTRNVSALLARLAKRGIWTVGIDPEGEPLWGGFDLAVPLALVIGSEGKGLRRLVRARCDVLLGIPMPGGGGSLNLSVAAGLALFEVVRRRSERGATSAAGPGEPKGPGSAQ